MSRARIRWRTSTGATGHGDWIDVGDVHSYVRDLNRRHLDIHHWVECPGSVEDGGPDGTGPAVLRGGTEGGR